MTCVRQGQPCPINDVFITDQKYTLSEGYNSAPLDNGLKIVFTSNGTELPIVRLRLTEEEVCSNPSEHALSKGRSLYKLLRTGGYNGCNSWIAGSYSDPRYTKIGTVREDRLYEDNGVSYVVRNLPMYPASDSQLYYWNLFTGNYFYWNQECDNYGLMSREYVFEQVDNAIQIDSAQSTLMIVCIIYLILLCIIDFIGYSHKVGLSQSPVLKEREHRNVFAIVAPLIQGFFLIFILIKSFGCSSTISGYNTMPFDCSDNFSNKVFNFYGVELVSHLILIYI